MATRTASATWQCEEINHPIKSREEISRLLNSKPNLSQSSGRIHKVSPQLRMKDRQGDTTSVYDPAMVSLGPYHHGKPEFRQAEEFKYICLDWCSDGGYDKKQSLYDMILKEIDEIKGCYAEKSILSRYNDEALALMMLLDACFILCFMENVNDSGKTPIDWRTQLGFAGITFTTRDIMVLENQIPFFVLQHLMDELYKEEDGKKSLNKLLSWILNVKLEQVTVNPREENHPPRHILEACWRVIAGDTSAVAEDGDQQHSNCNFLSSRRLSKWFRLRTTKEEGSNQVLPVINYKTCQSATNLEAKGIYLCPSTSHSLKDIQFKSYQVYGRLHLPVRHVSDQTHVILSNMIAYELSPDVETNLEVLSYTKFMKSLIETPADVKQLQEKGIIVLNRFANLDQVVQLFKSIDTFGLENTTIYKDVLHQAGKHYNSIGKTWMADLIHSKLSSPWTIIALLSAILILVLTSLQTIYTINPRNT